ncbi:MAG: class I SAM-dependent methyltransferase [Azoarcus sp.]|jgi:hypothetical protein|nr:class I SAM-dependent methyltransferase [Azoarcus sp.]
MTVSDKPFVYDHDNVGVADAVLEAQRIAFGPIIFQAAVCLRDFGILACLKRRGAEGATLDEIVADSALSGYAAGVLLDAGLSARMIYEKEERFYLGRVGLCLLKNKMTRINMDFIRDICYAGMANLGQAIREGAPGGLSVFGNWPTIYPALSSLPEPAKKSWFAFDHFYSDNAFSPVLPHVFRDHPRHIYDVGGNTGRWALRCVEYDADVHVTVLDLPEQVALLEGELAAQQPDFSTRIHARPINILEDGALPGEADVWWMSQFLDCFPENQIIGILTRIRRAMKPDARIFILEPLCDRQRFEESALTLNVTSLYFTCMANGNSRFFRAKMLEEYLGRAGFMIEETIDGLGIGGHTLTIAVMRRG